MWYNFIILGAFIELIIMLKAAKADISGCHFLETVNISSSQRLQNGSYIFQDLEIPVNVTGQYDYDYIRKYHIIIPVKSHLRGCVCHLKPCIRICCRLKDWDETNNKCIDGLMEELSEINPFLKVTLSNESVVNRNLLNDFVVLRDRMQGFDIWEENKYKLYENGSLLLNSSNTVNFRRYDCLHPNQFTSGESESLVFALHINLCITEPIIRLPGTIELIWLSEVFLVLTIAVYLYVRKLRNLHGKCFICYMITTLFYFTHEMLRGDQIDSHLCVLYGYFMYFFFIAKFNWLLAMGHQLWRGFTSVNRAESEYSFGAYSILAWGTAAILMGVIFLCDQLWNNDPSKVEWVSGIGWQACFINEHGYCYLVFIILPILIVIVLNTILFVLTTISITRARLSMRHFSDQVECAKNLKSKMTTYYAFLRLFILMDIQWSVRLIYFIKDWKLLLKICMYCDLCNGFFIFVLFVLKSSTLKLLMDNIRKGRK